MKSLLILLLLVPTTFCFPNVFSRGSCLQHINAARSAFADRSQLANMNELVYNKKLEMKALIQLSYSGPCPQPSIISQNHLDVYLNVKGHDLIVELLSATGSTQMACVQSKCGDEDVISIVTDVQDSSPISGPPGTQCSSERLANSQGLCTQEYSRDGYDRKFSLGDVWEVVKAPVVVAVDTATKVANAGLKVLEKKIEADEAERKTLKEALKEGAKQIGNVLNAAGEVDEEILRSSEGRAGHGRGYGVRNGAKNSYYRKSSNTGFGSDEDDLSTTPDYTTSDASWINSWLHDGPKEVEPATTPFDLSAWLKN
ncbi:hypothetical protein B9Z55_007430 [Caenorhabditis nigoni]|uniref:Uncharacterized protein n=1 Tax=Caenorhabditis nigoni TaxID=1611254 RepID=A0A2G5VAA3_9PELO|nr:hypothetical protein B9Z55_007430 [Caenorhabditis nigoni]